MIAFPSVKIKQEKVRNILDFLFGSCKLSWDCTDSPLKTVLQLKINTGLSFMEREKLGSRLGFIFLAAACAIGLGNIWRFPYITGINGGACFVLLYLIFLAILGYPALIMELAMGTASQKNMVGAYRVLKNPKHPFPWEKPAL